FGMILGIAFLLIVSLVLSAATAALGKWWSGAFGSWEVLAQAVNLLVGYGVTTVAFAMIYKIMPRVKIQWHDVWLGAAVTALLFTVGRFLIGLYIGKSGIASGFGAAGSLVIIFVWVYYSAQIFLLGAEFTWVYARRFGSMRNIAEPDKPEDTSLRDIPSRSEEFALGPAVAYQTVEVPARPLWVSVGAGMAFLLALNYVGGRILRSR
ncbi:MAG TPA: YihY/virulence factor BrkB family protein, partial [Burkholderiaceae bacterium]|nr:YihY/virulence factor BrkB family protein [Burkholderiaceae bacterium]